MVGKETILLERVSYGIVIENAMDKIARSIMQFF